MRDVRPAGPASRRKRRAGLGPQGEREPSVSGVRAVSKSKAGRGSYSARDRTEKSEVDVSGA